MRNWEPTLLQSSISDHLSSRNCFLNWRHSIRKQRSGVFTPMSDYRTLDICSVADSQDLFIVEFGSYGSLLTFGLVTVTTAAEGLVVMSPWRQCYSLRIQPDCLWVGSDLSWDESTCGCPTGDNTSCDGLLAAVWAPGGNLPLATTTYCSLQVLTLASNERVALTPSMRLLFETHHLRTATPATVSRAGILYVNPQDLGWNPWAFLPFLTFFFLNACDMSFIALPSS